MPFVSKGYSVLTHEAIIDACWKTSIEPLLINKFPGTTTGGLLEAHAYAYGGSIAPDMGYYPFGSKLFTNLVHNVRTGDFVLALIENASTLNEYAFALGVLSHYMADNYGHSIATNVAVPLAFSDMKSKFGEVVTYADHHKSHSRVEFGFDLLQMARENYSPMSYRQLIGFKVSKRLMEKAFAQTYGLSVNQVFKNVSLALVSLRWSVKTIFPVVIKASLINRKAQIASTAQGAASKAFSLKMKNSLRIRHFKDEYEESGLSASVLAAILPLLPKMGPLAKLRFRPLSAEVEKLFVKSFDSAMMHYQQALARLPGQLTLPNLILDTGSETSSGMYPIADSSYDALLLLLKENNFEGITPGCSENILSFYRNQKPVGQNSYDQKIRTALTSLKKVREKDHRSVLSYKEMSGMDETTDNDLLPEN